MRAIKDMTIEALKEQLSFEGELKQLIGAAYSDSLIAAIRAELQTRYYSD